MTLGKTAHSSHHVRHSTRLRAPGASTHRHERQPLLARHGALGQLRAEGLAFTQTTAIAWESTLRGVLENIELHSVVDLSIVAPDAATGHWTLRRVSEIWLATPQETQEGGPLLFRMRDGSTLVNTYLEPVTDTSTRRKLLARVP